MKLIISVVLLVLFAVCAVHCSTSESESIRTAIEALEEAKQELLSHMTEVDSDRSFPFKRCVNSNNLIVRTDNAADSRERLNQETEVTIWAIKQMNGLDYAKIGYNRWVATKFLKMACSPVAPGITASQLASIMPKLSSSKAQEYLPHLNNAMAAGSINNCQRRSAFLAQLAHESGQLQWWEEFASGAAYEGRRDLGNTQSGDGRRFKGRGPIQLTGRANYRSAGSALGLPLESNPEMAKRTDVGFRTAVWFWSTRGLNRYADGSQSGFDTITRRVNGGFNGKADRDQYFRKAKSVLGC